MCHIIIRSRLFCQCRCSTMTFLMLLVLAIGISGQAEGKRILCVAVQQASHMGEVVGASNRLVDYGHEVYLVLSQAYPNPEKFEKQGFKVLTYRVSKELSIAHSTEYEKQISAKILSGSSPIEIDKQVHLPAAYRDCELMMKDEEFLKTIKRLKFEFAVTDGFIVCPCNTILAAYLDIPFALVSSTFHPYHSRTPFLPSFVSTIIQEVTDRLSLLEKLENLFNTFLVMTIPFETVRNTELLKQYAPKYTSWSDLRLKAQLFISSRDHVLERPMPRMPNVHHMPGLSYAAAKPLPPNLKEIMDSSPQGVIIVSFGSMFAHLPDEIILKFISAFKTLSLTIIWRLKLESQINIPANVHLLSWLPQNDLLAHPNTKLFITHCGNGGQYESVSNGVPMLGFPLFAEQHHNAFRMSANGLGLQMKLLDFTVDELCNNINEIFNNISYKKECDLRRAILEDRQMTPQEESAYWINHVIKHGGDHLRSSALDMPWWEYFMLDVLALLSMFMLLFSYIAFHCAQCINKRVFCAIFAKKKME